MWLELNLDGTPVGRGRKTKPYCYHIDQFSELQPIIHKMVEYGQARARHDPGRSRGRARPDQAQLRLRPRRATADNLSTFRQIARQVGAKLGAFPCFMPKPSWACRRTAATQHLALARRRERLPAGRTTAQAEPDRPQRIGGILEHLRRSRRDRVDRQLRTDASGTRVSGRRSSPTGGTRTATTAGYLVARPLRVPLGRLRRESVPALARAHQGHG